MVGEIEVRVAQKIDRTVHSNQPDGLHIPDHTVVFDGFKRHRQSVARLNDTPLRGAGRSDPVCLGRSRYGSTIDHVVSAVNGRRSIRC